ncbi:hypothetical protein BC828DRAFT_415336 [Blastocladiella britannica]|nr:hypothetical protein BC828DRAFT_415336 [Blastocladiella britannica]
MTFDLLYLAGLLSSTTPAPMSHRTSQTTTTTTVVTATAIVSTSTADTSASPGPASSSTSSAPTLSAPILSAAAANRGINAHLLRADSVLAMTGKSTSSLSESDLAVRSSLPPPQHHEALPHLMTRGSALPVFLHFLILTVLAALVMTPTAVSASRTRRCGTCMLLIHSIFTFIHMRCLYLDSYLNARGSNVSLTPWMRPGADHLETMPVMRGKAYLVFNKFPLPVTARSIEYGFTATRSVARSHLVTPMDSIVDARVGWLKLLADSVPSGSTLCRPQQVTVSFHLGNKLMHSQSLPYKKEGLPKRYGVRGFVSGPSMDEMLDGSADPNAGKLTVRVKLDGLQPGCVLAQGFYVKHLVMCRAL